MEGVRCYSTIYSVFLCAECFSFAGSVNLARSVVVLAVYLKLSYKRNVKHAIKPGSTLKYIHMAKFRVLF